MYELLFILIIATLGLLSHIAINHRKLKWLLRFIIGTISVMDAALFIRLKDVPDNFYLANIFAASSILSFLVLFLPFRKFISWLFTFLQLIITGQILLPVIRKKLKASEYFGQKRIFVPSSFPNLMALFIYFHVSLYLLTNAKFTGNIGPVILPTSQSIQQFLPYNGIPFLFMSLCGIGIIVTRSYKESFQRLSLLKPNRWQIGLGILLVLASFVYEAYWTIYTHSMGQDDLATTLSYYNSATFTLAGPFLPSVILALLTTLFAAIGEEVLIRGALQPVLGILPSALLHAMLLSHSSTLPISIWQLFVWSTFMGLVKRYTNTTTTIITHAGFNLFTILLFAANP